MQGIFRGRSRLFTALLTICALGVALALPSASAAPSHTTAPSSSAAATTPSAIKSHAGRLTSTVHGTFGRAGTVRGHFTPIRFIVKHGDPYAFGVLHAKLIRGNGKVIGHVTKRITVPVKRKASSPGARAAAASCDILNLVLGPLDLNLLGLHVHLNRVVLHIDAIPGAGNLLGNLLCAVAGLLDKTGLLNTLQLSNLLNRVLSVLRIV
jgi:hypothetical protein